MKKQKIEIEKYSTLLCIVNKDRCCFWTLNYVLNDKEVYTSDRKLIFRKRKQELKFLTQENCGNKNFAQFCLKILAASLRRLKCILEKMSFMWGLWGVSKVSLSHFFVTVQKYSMVSCDIHRVMAIYDKIDMEPLKTLQK